MKIIIDALDKATRAGVYTLEEVSIILNESAKLQNQLQELSKLKESESESEVKKH